MTGDNTAVHDLVPLCQAEARRLQARYGALVWFGHHTRGWWALVDRARLVEGKSPDQLGEAILAARRAGAWRWAP